MRLIKKVFNSLVGVVRAGASSPPTAPTPIHMDSALNAVIDIEGYFWADDSTDRVRGRLEWNRQAGELRLERVLRVIPTASTDEISVIHGRSLLGEPLCLTNCFVNRLDIAAVQYPQTWTVNGTLLGSDTADPEIQEMRVYLHGLRDFYGEPLVETKQSEAEGRDGIDIRWQSSPEVRVQLDTTELIFDDDWSMKAGSTSVELVARPRLRIASSAPAPEADLDEILGPAILLIGICRGAPLRIEEKRLVLATGEEIRSLSGYRPIDQPSSAQSSWLMLGNLTPLDRTVSAWMSLNQELPEATAMLAEYHRAGRSTPWSDRLLYLARFVEQYHRARHSSLRMPKADFRQRRREVRDALGGELGAWVYGLAEHANERRLAERLQELIDQLGDVVDDALPDPTVFGQEVADTRNYYTHYSEHLAEKAATDFDLVLLTKRLWLVVRALLLDELGFDSEASRTLLEFDGGLSWLIRKAAEENSPPDDTAED
jgi:hypothetical protein